MAPKSVSSFGSLRWLPTAVPRPSRIEVRKRRCAPIPGSHHPGHASRGGRSRRRPWTSAPAGGRRDEMRRTRTCKPSLSKSTRDLVSTSAPRNDPRHVSSLLHGVLPASATPTGSPDRRLLPIWCPCGRPLTFRGRRQEHALRRIARCRTPRPALKEARVNGPALRGFGTPFVRTNVRFRAPPADCLPIEMKPEHARE